MQVEALFAERKNQIGFRAKPGSSLNVRTSNSSTERSAINGTILIADDEECIAEIMRETLKTAGYQVKIAAGGFEALNTLDSGEKFDLLLCNLMMPYLDGFGVLERTKVRFPDMVFVIHTAVHDASVLSKLLHNGAYDCLLEPFAPEQLLSVVGRGLEYRKLKIENRELRAELEKLRS